MRIDDFLKQPTRKEWDAEIEAGWPGPDGSSASTDHIMGIQIGISSPDWKFSRMPANLHDWRYHLGRSRALHRHHRAAADREYRDDCIRVLQERLDGRIMTGIGIARAWARYYALRLFGRAAWRG